MSAPRVSVIIPCYNLGRYVDEAVDSVLAQTFTDVEILVIDDGSTDEETSRLLAGYRKPRTQVMRSENRGLPGAKNLGLAHTSGAYVCMLDADDRLDPSLLEKSVAALDADPGLAFVSHWLRYIGDETGDWTPTDAGFPALLDANTVNGAALVRRGALEAVHGFDETMRDGCEDWDVWIGLVERGFKGRILPEVLFSYRRRAESMSRVMMTTGVGHPHLYRSLAHKHAPAYASHIAPLVARREEDISNLRRHIHDLDLEHYARLGPELARRRDDVAALQQKAERVARERARVEQERARAEQERARIEERDELLGKAHAELDNLRGEIVQLRSSISWRLTAPLRALFDGARRLMGRRT